MGIAALRKPSLKRVTSKIHRDHLKRNPSSATLRYRAGRRLLVLTRERWGLSLAFVILLYLGVAGVTALVPPTDYGPQVPEDLTDYFRDLQTINLALLGVQATLLGLVYPLVIALVGMLFETRSSTGHRLQIYFSETEAAPVGALALTYIAVLAAQALAYGQLPLKVVGAVTVLNVIWFGINLAGLAFFVRRSLEFIQPTRRVDLTRSYIANTAWKAQLHELILTNRWVHAAHYGYLPADPATSDFIITPFVSQTTLLTRKFARPRRLDDVLFGVLSVALRSRFGRLTTDGVEGETTMSGWPGRDYPIRADLVRGVGALTWSERWLFRLAFRFKLTPRTPVMPTTQGLLAEGAADLVALFDAGRQDDFQARLREITDQHALYYHLAQSPDDGDGRPFNYAAMEESAYTLGMEWARAYRPLLDRLGETLSNDPRFFESGANLAARLQRRIPAMPHDAGKALFFLPMYIVHQLLRGAARTRPTDGTGSAGAAFTVTGPTADHYDRAWQNIVAGWETFADELTPIKRDDGGPTWAHLQALTPGLTTHLRDTAMMVARAAQTGETTAIRWTVDLMLKWDERVRRVWPTSNRSWALNRELPTLGAAALDWPEVAALPFTHAGEESAPIDVYDAAVNNAWNDTVVVLVCSLITRSTSPSPGVFSDGAAMAACALFQNREFDPGASYHPRVAPLSTTAVFNAILRTVGNGRNGDDGYGQSIESLAEQISQLEGPNYISGRIYGWSGEASISGHSATHGLILAASLDPAVPGRRRGAVIPGPYQPLLTPASDEARRDLIRHLGSMRDDLASIDRVQGAGLASALTASTIDVADIGERLDRVRDLIEVSLDVIRQARDAAVVIAPTDVEKLDGLAAAAGSKAFSKVTGAFPVSCFSAIESASGPLAIKPSTLDVRRGGYVTPPMDRDAGEDQDWWAAEMIWRVAEIVLLDALAASGAVTRAPRKAETYWRALSEAVQAVRAAGQTPVIVRPHRQSPSWLANWTFGSGTAPAGFSIKRTANTDEGYDFDLNDIPVYSSSAANGATWVFGLERLDRLTFQTFDGESFCAMALEPDASNIWKAKLRLSWGREVALAPGPAFRLRHPKGV